MFYLQLAVKLGDAEAAEEGAKLLGTLPSVSGKWYSLINMSDKSLRFYFELLSICFR